MLTLKGKRPAIRLLLATLIAISLLPFGYFDGFEQIDQNHFIQAKYHGGGGHHHFPSHLHHKKYS